jgi:glycyl-tRNA synthetase
MNNTDKSMDTLVALAKARGFVFQGSEIYGGLANSWDYGPLGAQLKMNIKNTWWNYFITGRNDMVGFDAAIFMNPKVWEASGHVGNFSDPQIDCKECKSRHRADHIIEDQAGVDVEGLSPQEIDALVESKKITCPKCGAHNFTPTRNFNLMFETSQGVIEGEKDSIYLRPETAQGIFVNFKNVAQTTRKKLPFGIGQIGKSFRNEITPGNFTYRTLEFEQAEIEYFFDPEVTSWEGAFTAWHDAMMVYLTSVVGLSQENLRDLEHKQEKLSHYSKRTVDIEYNYPFGGFKELWGLAYRTDYDLTQHQKHSGQSMEVFDQETNRKFIPHVIEPAVGVDRLVLAALIDAYDEESLEDGESRVVLRFNKNVAPYQIALLPLSKKDELIDVAVPVREVLSKKYRVDYDETQSIGKRYRRQDEIGTLYCVTVDFDSLEDQAVTVRDRDTMKQDRVKTDELDAYFAKKLG